MKVAPQNSAVPPLVGLVRAVRDCCQRKEGELCRRLALTASQFACLLCLPESAGCLSVREVAKIMGLSPSRASRVVDSLVRAGLLSRRSLDRDRRLQLLALTSTGQQKWAAAQKLLQECEEHLLAGMNAYGSRELQESLTALIEAW